MLLTTLKEAKSNLDREGWAQHAEIRKALMAHHSLSNDEVTQSLSRIHSSVPKEKQEYVKRVNTEFVRMTGGKGRESAKTIEQTDSRAHADLDDRSINIGGGLRSEIFHELGHHIEFNNLAFNKAAIDFRAARATSDKPEHLSILTGKLTYSSREKALPGNFIAPYVGKVYPGTEKEKMYAGSKFFQPTEVISMGIKNFGSEVSMYHFHRKDPEHFHLILGMMLAKP